MTKKGLTELQCKNAKPQGKRYRLADTGGRAVKAAAVNTTGAA